MPNKVARYQNKKVLKLVKLNKKLIKMKLKELIA